MRQATTESQELSNTESHNKVNAWSRRVHKHEAKGIVARIARKAAHPLIHPQAEQPHCTGLNGILVRRKHLVKRPLAAIREMTFRRVKGQKETIATPNVPLGKNPCIAADRPWLSKSDNEYPHHAGEPHG